MTLAELIRYRATTQTALARRLGMAKQNLNKYVQGLRTPKLETALRFAGALNAGVKITPGGFDYVPGEENGEKKEKK